MHLPSGRSIGHRSLARYYRQNLRNYPTAEEREARQLAIENGEVAPEEQKPKGHDNHHRAVISRGNGGSGMVGVTDTQRSQAITSERKDRSRAIRQELRVRNRVNRAANHQQHFRVCSSSFLRMYLYLTYGTGSPPSVIASYCRPFSRPQQALLALKSVSFL